MGAASAAVPTGVSRQCSFRTSRRDGDCGRCLRPVRLDALVTQLCKAFAVRSGVSEAVVRDRQGHRFGDCALSHHIISLKHGSRMNNYAISQTTFHSVS